MIGDRLVQAALFNNSIAPGEIIAARHVFDVEPRRTELWIGVGWDQKCTWATILVICLGAPSANVDELQLLYTIEPE